MKKFLFYAPRILSFFIVAFFALFILEGFSSEFHWQDGLMHGLLALAVLVATIVAWKWPKIGGWAFVAFGLWYLVQIIGERWYGGVVIGVVPLVTGILFLMDGSRGKKSSL